MCHMSWEACRLSPVTCHMSYGPTDSARDPPPANSPTMYSRMVCKDLKIYFFCGVILDLFWARIENSKTSFLSSLTVAHLSISPKLAGTETVFMISLWMTNANNFMISSKCKNKLNWVQCWWKYQTTLYNYGHQQGFVRLSLFVSNIIMPFLPPSSSRSLVVGRSVGPSVRLSEGFVKKLPLEYQMET